MGIKLPALRSAPLPRHAMIDPATAAAGASAISGVATEVGAMFQQRAKESAAADYEDRSARIKIHDVKVRQAIASQQYIPVSELPSGIAAPDGSIENRDGVDMVPMYSVQGALYENAMGAYVGELADSAGNEAVTSRLKSDALTKIMLPAGEKLFIDAMSQSKMHDEAKFKVSLAEYIRIGDEDSALELVARAVETLGINEEAAIAGLGSEIDQSYFSRESMQADNSSQIEVLKNQLTEGKWRFDRDTSEGIYTKLIKREADLDKEEAEIVKVNQNDAFVEAMGMIATEGMTMDEVHALKWLRPEQYKGLLTMAQTDASTFTTPSRVKLWMDRQIQGVKNGNYGSVDAEDFAQAQTNLRERLDAMVGQFDPFTGENYDQRISAVDYARYSEQLQSLEQIGYENKQVSIGQKQIYIMVAGASQEAFDFNPNKDSARQVALNDALADYHRYIEEAGPDVDPMKWVEDNLYKYTSGPAKASLLGIHVAIYNSGSLIYTPKGTMDFTKTLEGIEDQLTNALANGATDSISDMREALAEMDLYKKEFPLNAE